MNKTLLMKWIKALESGKYPQITKQLSSEYGFCCLGVLCKVAKQSYIPNEVGYDFIKTQLTDDEMTQLWALNDNLKLPFPVIAANLRGMFDV